MNPTLTHKLLAVGAIALAAAGGGVAVAARGGDAHPAASVAAPASFAAAQHGPRGFHELDAVVSYLGLTPDQIRTQLESGKTLAQIADATPGKSATGLVAAIVAAAKQDLAAAVSAGRLTQAQADRIAANLEQRVSAFVNRTPPPGGPAMAPVTTSPRPRATSA